MLIAGHIAGIPIEEALLGFMPAGAVGIGALVSMARGRRWRLRGRRVRPRLPGRRRPR